MSTVHLDLLLSFDARTVGGSLREEDGTVRPFCGWLGLFAALERLKPGDDGQATEGGTR